jgi:7,8-dihydro-6-hydroxymethylpterin-pyrophosphokinase
LDAPMNTTATSAAAEAHQAAVLLAAIEAMETTLGVAEALASGHRRIDLDGLEDEMGRICAACLTVPQSAAPAIRARLEALLRLLDRLQGAIAPG